MQYLKTQDWFDGRDAEREAFLVRTGWQGAALAPVGEDSAFRRYFRLTRVDGQTVILMEAVPDGGAIATPGHRLADFIKIGERLRADGLRAPEIYAADEAQGYLLLEDFGDISLKRACHSGCSEGSPPDSATVDRQNGMEELYMSAIDVLLILKDVSTEDLPDYYQSHVHAGRRRVIDWYLPALRGVRDPDGMAEEYLAVWDGIERSLPSCPQGFLHIDYHVENLMWLSGTQEGLSRCGILDFQGAMRGPLPYDLANLLEDARQEIPLDLRERMMARYCAGMAAGECEVFSCWYRVLATQFHCRVAGQFIRLAVRDGKDRYLAHLPRLTRYLHEGLAHPVLAPLKNWFDAQGVTFCESPSVEAEKLRALIREDAF